MLEIGSAERMTFDAAAVAALNTMWNNDGSLFLLQTFFFSSMRPRLVRNDTFAPGIWRRIAYNFGPVLS